MKLKNYVGWIRHPERVSPAIKKAYESHPQRKMIESIVVKKIADSFYKKYEKVIDLCIHQKPLKFNEKRRLRKLAEKLRSGSGYTRKTRRNIDVELPKIVERFCSGKQTEEDAKAMQEVKDFVNYLKQKEVLSHLEVKDYG